MVNRLSTLTLSCLYLRISSMNPSLFPNPGDPEPNKQPELEQTRFSPSKSRPSKFRLIIIISIACAVIICIALTVLLYFKLIPPAINQSKKTTETQKIKSTVNRQALDDTFAYYKDAGIKEFNTADKTKVLDKVEKLTNNFKILPAFFDDKLNNLFALSTAYSSLQGKSNDKYFRASMYLLMRDNLTERPEDIVEDSRVELKSDDRDKKSIDVIKKYTDTELTSKLNEAVKDRGVYKSTAKSISLDNTDMFKDVNIVALNFAQSDFKDFSKEHYMYGSNPAMWAEELDGKQYVMSTKNYAEDYISKNEEAITLGIQRMLIHTTSSFVRGEYGRTIEQRRADLFTGNKTDEYDIRQFFIYLNVFSGYDLLEDLKTYPTSPEDFYLKLYKDFGIQTASKIIAVSPGFYDGNTAISTYDDARMAFGGYDGALEGAIKIGQKNEPAMKARMLKRSQKLYSIFKTKADIIEDLRYSMGRRYNMSNSAKFMEDYINTVDDSQLAKLESD